MFERMWRRNKRKRMSKRVLGRKTLHKTYLFVRQNFSHCFSSTILSMHLRFVIRKLASIRSHSMRECFLVWWRYRLIQKFRHRIIFNSSLFYHWSFPSNDRMKKPWNSLSPLDNISRQLCRLTFSLYYWISWNDFDLYVCMSNQLNEVVNCWQTMAIMSTRDMWIHVCARS